VTGNWRFTLRSAAHEQCYFHRQISTVWGWHHQNKVLLHLLSYLKQMSLVQFYRMDSVVYVKKKPFKFHMCVVACHFTLWHCHSVKWHATTRIWKLKWTLSWSLLSLFAWVTNNHAYLEQLLLNVSVWITCICKLPKVYLLSILKPNACI